ncbi:MAG: zinc transporter ZIP family [Fusobacteria bacterium]|nr:MAG: zinc transporter ZIP family [Fusobacteriota bacterium]KAF0228759.1 MAG: zinc transporter ZIP [Fusobacteriota bacterium]
MNELMNNGVLMAFLATLFTWGLTALGAALVFFFKSIKRDVLDSMLGFAAGVMVAASFWSLLAPGISLAEELGQNAVLMAASGFMAGGVFLFLVDRLLPHMHLQRLEPEGLKSSWNRSVLLVLAITLHNIPEGLAIGVAFGAAASGEAGFGGAVALAIGIGLQNFPEGAAVSIPLRREGLSRLKSFTYGQLSGIVEPVAAVLGALLAVSIRGVLPFALSFAAGAMIYVVVEELIPESQGGKGNRSSDLISIFTMVGFVVMMILDVALG